MEPIPNIEPSSNLVLLIRAYGFQPSNLVTIEHWSKFKAFCGLGNLLVLGPGQRYNLTNDFKGFHKGWTNYIETIGSKKL